MAVSPFQSPPQTGIDLPFPFGRLPHEIQRCQQVGVRGHYNPWIEANPRSLLFERNATKFISFYGLLVHVQFRDLE